MNCKEIENILEFIKFQKSTLKKYYSFIRSKMKSDYKKAAIFVYWLNDYINYIKSESSFKPSLNITYKRGQIIFVNFGFRIGRELGGNHYAIVLDTKNSKNGYLLTVVPLKSKKSTQSKYASIYHVSLGDCVKNLLVQKALHVIGENAKTLSEITPQICNDGQELNPETINKLGQIKRTNRMAREILEYAEKLKDESIADVGQITTISKQRINHPCKSKDILTNVIIPKELMTHIENKIKKLYISDTVENDVKY